MLAPNPARMWWPWRPPPVSAAPVPECRCWLEGLSACLACKAPLPPNYSTEPPLWHKQDLCLCQMGAPACCAPGEGTHFG